MNRCLRNDRSSVMGGKIFLFRLNEVSVKRQAAASEEPASKQQPSKIVFKYQLSVDLIQFNRGDVEGRKAIERGGTRVRIVLNYNSRVV